MHQLTGKYVNVVLSVECGRGMDFLKNNVHITGSFNNRILESDGIPANDCPPFNTELVWEIEKKELRKIRSANLPLRVECISVDIHNRKERVGFTLLSLRSAHIISQKNINQEISSQWHKLIGCQSDKKRRHPELYISLTLRDHSLDELDVASSNEKIPYISEEDNRMTEETTGSEYPIKYFEDGHIQIGDEDTAKFSFTFNFLVKKVANLDALLPEVLIFKKNNPNYYLSFKILGVSIRTKSFSKELHKDIELNEKIVINLLSSKDMLSSFFESHTTSIIFCCGSDILGITNVELEDTFNSTETKCFFKFPSANGIVPFGNSDKSPFIELRHWTEENVRVESSEDDVPEKVKTKTIFSSITQRPTDLEDTIQSNGIMEDTPREGANVKVVLCEELNASVTKSFETFINGEALSPTLPEVTNMYKKFTFEITLSYIIWKSSMENKKITFKFLHPRAASCTTILTEITNTVGKKIVLHNLHVKVSYLSTTDKIEKQLQFWQPRLVLTDDRENVLCQAYNLDINCLNKHNKEFEITLIGYQNAEPIAKLGVNVALKMIKVQESEDYEHLHLLPIIIDEVIIIKEISDLEKWKENEKKRFENELDLMKSIELKKLEKEWDEKKNKLEEQVAMIVNKCEQLQDELRNKMSVMKIDKALIRNQNHTLMYEKMFKENWTNFSDDSTKEVIELLSRTQRDNQLLKKMCDEQRQKLNRIEKTSLTKSQTTDILKELSQLEHKFEEAQNAKSYFKEQWKRACEEIHSLKAEDMKNMQIHIKRSREELSQLSLDEYCDQQNRSFDDNNRDDDYCYY